MPVQLEGTWTAVRGCGEGLPFAGCLAQGLRAGPAPVPGPASQDEEGGEEPVLAGPVGSPLSGPAASRGTCGWVRDVRGGCVQVSGSDPRREGSRAPGPVGCYRGAQGSRLRASGRVLSSSGLGLRTLLATSGGSVCVGGS